MQMKLMNELASMKQKRMEEIETFWPPYLVVSIPGERTGDDK